MTWSQYAAGWASQHGGYDPRRAPSLSRGWHRFGYRAGRVLARLGVRPGLLTLVGLGLAVAVPFVAPHGPSGLLAAAALVALCTLAGTLARALGVLILGASPRVAIRETVADRLAEVAWLLGCWLAGTPGPLILACGMVTWLHEYVREQALGAGMSRAAAQTTGERPTRVSVAVTGLVLAGLAGATGFAGGGLAPGVLTMAVAVWLLVAVLGLHQVVTALRRCVP